MTFRNTSEWPTGEVRDLVRFATRDIDMRGVHVNVKPCRNRPARGWAYDSVPSISSAPRGARYLITLGVNPDATYPRERWKRRGEPKVWLNDWREVLVFLAAHEAKHIEQYREALPRSEVRCNVFAYHVLQAYREQRDRLDEHYDRSVESLV